MEEYNKQLLNELCNLSGFDFGFEKLEDIYRALIVEATFRVV